MSPAGPSRGRERMVFFGLVLAGALVLLYAFGQTWAAVTIDMPDPAPDANETVKGVDLMMEAGIAPWLALASMAGIYATRRVGRVVIGALLAVMSGALIWAMWDELDQETLMAPYQGRGAEQVTVTAVNHGWWALALAASVLILVAGVFACVRGAYWPRMGTRYDRARPQAPATARPTGAEGMWAAFDAGDDPTARPPAEDGRQDIKEQ